MLLDGLAVARFLLRGPAAVMVVAYNEQQG